MENFENQFKKKENSTEKDIWNRKEIHAPENFVSVFHETKEQFLDAINESGLKLHTEAKNIGSADKMKRKNILIDSCRPEKLKTLGISRNNLYGYPYLEHGHGLMGADQRYIPKKEEHLRSTYESMEKYVPESLMKLGFSGVDDYVQKLQDKNYLRTQYPGEILELKVDPEKCFVGDLKYITQIQNDIDRGWSEEEAVKLEADYYWKNLVSLKDFLRWYRKPEWNEDGDTIKNVEDYMDEPISTSDLVLLKGAPEGFPSSFTTPEILIPNDIPQEYIRVLP